ncbi:MAG: peptidase M14, partial [Comamonadaceae bacterium]|nr:peptidase M14 [Comamonadaceae bacterium]
MTTPPSTLLAPSPTRAPAAVAHLTAACAAALLAACTSTPLPPWPTTPGTATAPRPAAPAPLPPRAQPGVVVATPPASP